MTSIFKLKFNNLAQFEKTGFVTSCSKECHVMLWINFPKLFKWDISYHIFVEPFIWILLRHLKRSLHFLFSLSTHALTCLRITNLALKYKNCKFLNFWVKSWVKPFRKVEFGTFKKGYCYSQETPVSYLQIYLEQNIFFSERVFFALSIEV